MIDRERARPSMRHGEATRQPLPPPPPPNERCPLHSRSPLPPATDAITASPDSPASFPPTRDGRFLSPPRAVRHPRESAVVILPLPRVTRTLRAHSRPGIIFPSLFRSNLIPVYRRDRILDHLTPSPLDNYSGFNFYYYFVLFFRLARANFFFFSHPPNQPTSRSAFNRHATL